MIFASRSVWCIRFGFSHPHEYATVVCNYYLLVSVHAQAGLTDRILRPYTAISRKVVGKSARDYPRRYCGWFWVHWSSKKFERMALEAIEVCFRVIIKRKATKVNSCSVRDTVLIISHITFRDCSVDIFSDNLSQNSCIFPSTSASNVLVDCTDEKPGPKRLESNSNYNVALLFIIQYFLLNILLLTF